MSYSINYTSKSLDDLDGIYRYIAFTLQEPETAENIYRQITKSIRSLDFLPLRNPLFKDERLQNAELREMFVKNYVVFYTVNEQDKVVTVVRIMYGGRNLTEQLKN